MKVLLNFIDEKIIKVLTGNIKHASVIICQKFEFDITKKVIN